MDWSRCLVGKSYWIHDVRIVFCFYFNLISLYFVCIHNILCFLCMVLQIAVMEISLCAIFFTLTTISSSCCFSWFVWKQIWSCFIMWFMLGSIFISCWTINLYVINRLNLFILPWVFLWFFLLNHIALYT